MSGLRAVLALPGGEAFEQSCSCHKEISWGHVLIDGLTAFSKELHACVRDHVQAYALLEVCCARACCVVVGSRLCAWVGVDENGTRESPALWPNSER